jgi:hypothetical protein
VDTGNTSRRSSGLVESARVWLATGSLSLGEMRSGTADRTLRLCAEDRAVGNSVTYGAWSTLA